MGAGIQDTPNPVKRHWSTFKIDGIKALEDYKKLLDQQGLKDPWIRNEVWKFRPNPGVTSTFGLMRVAGYAVVLAGIMTLVRNNLLPRDKYNEPYLL